MAFHPVDFFYNNLLRYFPPTARYLFCWAAARYHSLEKDPIPLLSAFPSARRCHHRSFFPSPDSYTLQQKHSGPRTLPAFSPVYRAPPVSSQAAAHVIFFLRSAAMFAPDGTARDIHQLGRIFEPGSIHPLLFFHVKYFLRNGKNRFRGEFHACPPSLFLLSVRNTDSVSFLLLVLLHFNGPFLPRRERKYDHQSRDCSPFLWDSLSQAKSQTL